MTWFIVTVIGLIWLVLAVIWVVHSARHVHRDERWYDYVFAAPLFVFLWAIDGYFALRRLWKRRP
jgi:hypothetical protein